MDIAWGAIAAGLANQYSDNVSALILSSPAFDWLRKEEKAHKLIKRLIKILTIPFDKSERKPLRKQKLAMPRVIKEFIAVTQKYKKDIIELDVPTLIIHGENDKVTPVRLNEEIFNRMKAIKRKFIIITSSFIYVFTKRKSA